jgi:hypothetical protein
MIMLQFLCSIHFWFNGTYKLNLLIVGVFQNLLHNWNVLTKIHIQI